MPKKETFASVLFGSAENVLYFFLYLVGSLASFFCGLFVTEKGFLVAGFLFVVWLLQVGGIVRDRNNLNKQNGL